MRISVKIKALPNSVEILPDYGTQQSAGMDLRAANYDPIVIKPKGVSLIPTGIAIALPEGLEAQIRPRSGLALKQLVTVLNSPGTIDADYRGEIKVILMNHSDEDFIIERNMKIAQMIITKYEHISWNQTEFLDDTERGEGGFGSTGK